MVLITSVNYTVFDLGQMSPESKRATLRRMSADNLSHLYSLTFSYLNHWWMRAEQLELQLAARGVNRLTGRAKRKAEEELRSLEHLYAKDDDTKKAIETVAYTMGFDLELY